ncbi:MAG: ABC transporter substrate-binding protein [Lachnospiraceae bacterium]|nr:ABC transporter substrate-binding protein [Lachnospiraceae bacterium]
MKKKMFSMFLALTLAVGMTACGSSSSGSETTEAETTEETEAASEAEGDFVGTITLGMIGPMTGSLAVYGTHVSNGVLMAVDEINAAGGVMLSDGAYELAVSSKDDQGDSTECLNAMNALIADGIELVIGSATSGFLLSSLRDAWH